VNRTLRIGIDVGGTFTKAVAVETAPLRLRAHAVVPTSHESSSGVADGVAAALTALLAELGEERQRVALVAFSTTQAMNALLEGDVGRVGVLGIGAKPDLRRARKRTQVGEVALAPGRRLKTAHAFVDATDGLDPEDVDAAVAALAAAGCASVAVSGALAVDNPEDEDLAAARVRAAGLPACTGHELSGAYGLEMRTVSAAVNASILPVVERTADVVRRALAEAGVDVPLLVLRGDGGAMSVDCFRERPSFTIGSGPAAGVAATLHQLRLADAIVVECGGTSSNVSVIRDGRPVLRSLRVMGRPTCVRAVDSWVVGAAGGSMPLLGRRGIVAVGPRSAHVAGLPYACFADAGTLADATLELVAPRPGDPEAYACVRAGGRLYALTATCAANALGLVDADAHAFVPREAALAALRPLAERLRCSREQAAQRVLDGAVRQIAKAVQEAASHHDLPRHVPLVALGGAGAALVPVLARQLGRPLHLPEHAEVLSSIGAAVSLVRAEAVRNGDGTTSALELAREAELACVASGAAPATVTVETSYDRREGLLRAVATGAVALETGAADREPATDEARLRSATAALGLGADRLQLVATTDFYRVYSENGSGRVAAVDPLGAVALAEDAHRVLVGEGHELVETLRREVEAAARNLGVATLMPRIQLVCGSRILDLSDARRADEVATAAIRALADHPGPAVAVVAR
jgi:N-methylhydantoinase A/oxoprolinase/acetone carboxylase beta subunit